MGVAWSWAGRRPAAGGTFRVGRNHPRERGTGRGWGEAWRLGLQTRSHGRGQRLSQAGCRGLSSETFPRPLSPPACCVPAVAHCGCSEGRGAKNRKPCYCLLNSFPPTGSSESEGGGRVCARRSRAELRGEVTGEEGAEHARPGA